VLSVNTACAASANAIGYASELIRQGRADAVLAGGAEALSEVLYSGFNALESLSPHPAAPYSLDREGLSLGEGGGMLVLMREDLARELGAPIKAELLAYSLSADGYHPTAPRPDGSGAGRAIKAALAAAGVEPGAVNYVNSHATGTAKNDPAVTAATKYGLGDHAYSTAVSSTKSMIGHLLGAAGAVENIVTVRAIETQTAPPTANYTTADPECDLDYVPNEARAMNIDVAVSNNFAFGGANASIVWAKPGARPAPPAPDRDRVVITGMTAFTSVGTDAEALWQAYSGGEAGRVDFEPSTYLKPKERKRVDRIGLFAVITGRLALEDAALEITDDNSERVGVIVGTGIGPMQSLEEFSLPIIEEGPTLANPAVFPNTVYNAAGGQTAIKLGALGVASTVTAQHAAGAQALTYAYDLTSVNQAEVVLAIASDSLTDTVVDAYRDLGLLGGFAIAEAGISLVVERAGAAAARGARVYGELAGYGVTSDAEGVGRWNREGAGVERAMRVALEMAGVDAGDVVAVWANAAGLEQADGPEREAIARVFGVDVAVRTPKVKLGEPLGAGGSLNTVLALLAWQHGVDVGPVVVNSSSLGGTHIDLGLVPSEAS
jgi:3-oxoacyl-[acyl-carrier-protein] synthase II